MFIVKNCSYVSTQTYIVTKNKTGVTKWVKNNPNTSFKVFNTHTQNTQKLLKRKGVQSLKVYKVRGVHKVQLLPMGNVLTLTQFTKQFC